MRPTSKTSARSSTRVGGETSAPKTRTPIRLKPRIGPTPSPWLNASFTASSQSASTPRLTGFSRQWRPAAVNVTGTSDSAAARRSSFRRAWPAVSPPTSTPSILTPAAIVLGDPAKIKPSTAPPTAATIASTTSRCASNALERLRRRLRTRAGPVPASTRKARSLAAAPAGLRVARQEDLAGDHEALDLRRALVDLEQLGVPHQLLDRVLLDVAV